MHCCLLTRTVHKHSTTCIQPQLYGWRSDLVSPWRPDHMDGFGLIPTVHPCPVRWVWWPINVTQQWKTQRVASTPCDSNTNRKECLDSHVPGGPREEQACTILTISTQTTPAARWKSSPNPHLRHEYGSNNRNILRMLCEKQELVWIVSTIEANKNRNLMFLQRKTCFIFTFSFNTAVVSCPCPCLCECVPVSFPVLGGFSSSGLSNATPY